MSAMKILKDINLKKKKNAAPNEESRDSESKYIHANTEVILN